MQIECFTKPTSSIACEGDATCSGWDGGNGGGGGSGGGGTRGPCGAQFNVYMTVKLVATISTQFTQQVLLIILF